MPQVPETYEALEQIFNSCPKYDIPLDLTRYSELPISEMVLKFSNSLRRLEKFEKSKAPEDVINSERSLAEKYRQVLLLRRGEFILFIKHLNQYSYFSEDEILKNMNPICLAIHSYIKKHKKA